MKGADDLHVWLTLRIIYGRGHGFCKGVADLLHGVEDYGSLNLAASHMRLAYSKAWHVVGDAEKMLKVPLLNRDGVRGSTLTPEGKKLLAINDRLFEETNEFLQRRLKELIEQ
jgi:molybdate transport system regulatory protein